MSEMDALDYAIGQYVQRGWDVHQATLTGVQLKHPSGRAVYLTAKMAAQGDLPQLEQTPWKVELPVVKRAEPSPAAAFADGFFGGNGYGQAWKGPMILVGVLLGAVALCILSVVGPYLF